MANNNPTPSQPQPSVPDKNPGASSAAFAQHLDRASTIVQRWPVWKQQLLGRTAVQSSTALRASAGTSNG
jgi:hypothetical protein